MTCCRLLLWWRIIGCWACKRAARVNERRDDARPAPCTRGDGGREVTAHASLRRREGGGGAEPGHEGIQEQRASIGSQRCLAHIVYQRCLIPRVVSTSTRLRNLPPGVTVPSAPASARPSVEVFHDITAERTPLDAICHSSVNDAAKLAAFRGPIPLRRPTCDRACCICRALRYQRHRAVHRMMDTQGVGIRIALRSACAFDDKKRAAGQIR